MGMQPMRTIRKLAAAAAAFALVLLCSCGAKKAPPAAALPQSIVALSPSAAEILFAVGAGGQVAAVSAFTDYPPEAAQKPVVGGFDGKTLSVESIMAFRPDLVYLTDGMHNFLISTLESNGIAYYVSRASSIESVEQEILDVGRLTGHVQEAQGVVDGMEAKLREAASLRKSGTAPVAVYYEVWNAPYMSVGASSFIDDIITRAGGTNIFHDLAEAYPMVSEETIISRAPEYILLPSSSGLPAESVRLRDGWADIPAVRAGRMHVVDDNVYTRPGPRVADVVCELAGLLAQ